MLIIGGVTLVLFALFGISKIGESEPNANLSQSDTIGEPPLLNKLESAVYSAIIYDDLCTLVDDGESLVASKGVISPVPMIVSSKKLQAEYEKNEVSADQQYKGKQISVSGIVQGIDKTIGDTIMIGLNGGSNPFIYPRAIIEPKYENWAGSLIKGDKVGMICNGNGMAIGSASLSDCIPSYDWADGMAKDIINNTKAGLENKNEFFVKMVKVTKGISSKLKTNSKCLVEHSHKECMEEIENVLSTSKAPTSAL